MESEQNRNEAFRSIIDRLPEKRALIYNLFSSYQSGVTTQRLSDDFNIRINEITGRINELKELCLIKEVGSNVNIRTNNKNTMYLVEKDANNCMKCVAKKLELYKKRLISLKNDHLKCSSFARSVIFREINKYEKKIDFLLKNTALKLN